MSGFDNHWLTLREPADHTARDRLLVDRLAELVRKTNASTVVDMGCGTGSTWRALRDAIPDDIQWRLLDHDPALLAQVQRRLGENESVSFHEFDLNQVAELPLTRHAVVTASALFDLASEAFCSALIDRLAAHECILYAALNYDGVIRWSEPHPLDGTMVAAFNHHQQTEKEFGLALGPDATACLERLLKARQYEVRVQPSPWQLGAQSAELQVEFVKGIGERMLEMTVRPETEIRQWLSFRLDAARRPGSVCTVGHTDLLAYPDQSSR